MEGSSGNDAIFTYKPSPGSPVVSDPSFADRSPNLVLHSVRAGGRTVNYEFEEVFPGSISVDNELINVSMTAGSSTGSTGENWVYEYHPAAEFIPDTFFLSANSGALASVTSRFGGRTSYEYQFIESATGAALADIKAIQSKTSQGLGTWTYTFNVGSDGYNRTTVNAPENIVTQYRHCNLSATASECISRGGYLVEQTTSGSGAQETTTYEWVSSPAISPQNTIPQRYAGFVVSYGLFTTINRMSQVVVNRNNEYLATIYGNYDEFDNPAVIGEKRTDQFVPIGHTGFTIDPNDPNTRLTSLEYENKTGAELWMLGLTTFSQMPEPISVASSPVRIDTDQIMAYTYTNRGNVQTESRYGSVTQYSYDNNGNLELVIDPNGNRFRSSNFVLGVAQTEQRSLTLAGAEQTYLTRVVDNRSGRVVSQTVFRDIGSGESYTTSIDYDDLGRAERVTRPRGAITEVTHGNTFTRTVRGLLTTTEEFDSFGRMTKMTTSGPGINYTATSEYDAYGRVTGRVARYGSGESQYETTYVYDGLSRVLSESNNVDNQSKTYSYNGLRTDVTDRKGQTTTFQHRAFSNFSDTQLLSITQEVGGGEANIVTTIEPTKLGAPLSITQGSAIREFAYDGRYRVVEFARPESFNATFTYDENGNVKTRSLGYTVVSYDYDGRNNAVSINYSRRGVIPGFGFGEAIDDALSQQFPAEDVTFAYNDDNTVRESANSDSVWTYSYDPNGNLLSENLNLLGDINRNFDIAYQYDANDNQSEIVYPSGKVVALAPDALGRPGRLGEFLNNIQYTSTNTVASATYGNGRVWSTTQNANKFVESNSVDGVFTETYGYDDNYNIDEVDSTISGLRTYEFDGINRLNRMRMGTGDWESYSYDVNSNITSNAFPEVQGRSTAFTDIEYNQTTQLPTVGLGFTEDGSDIPFGTNIGHDIHGNINSFGDYDYLFDGAGYLRGVTRNSVLQAEYDYDANGLRTVIDKNGETVVTVYGVNGDLLHEYHAQKQMQSDYVYLNNYLISRFDTERVWTLEEDADQDRLPNEFDPDDDNDGQLDVDELACGSDPFDANSISADADNDGVVDCNDDIIDSDFDGTADIDDAFPNDPAESGDFDADGIGNNADLDDDNDGQSDVHEVQCLSDPFDSNSLGLDADGNGVPDCILTELDQGPIYLWGDTDPFGAELITNLPTGSDFVKVVGGRNNALALRADGSLAGWGRDSSFVNGTPTGNDFISIDIDGDVGVAIRTNGRTVVWGGDFSTAVVRGSQPSPVLRFTAASVSGGTGSFAVGLRDNGGITTWGSSSISEGKPTEFGHRAVAAGQRHAVAIRADGSLVTWGSYGGQAVSDTPSGNDFVAIAAGTDRSMALRSDGSIVTWGTTGWDNITDTPSGNDFIAVAADGLSVSALRSDGTVVTWGRASFTEATTEAPASSGFVVMDMGYETIVAICTTKSSLDCVDDTVDTDFDGIIDNLDTDDDNDGLQDRDELSCGSDPKDVASSASDTDSDGIPNCLDLFPLDSSETIDTDLDGVGDNADTDDDDDGQSDSVEATCNTDPKSAASFGVDSDSDGEPDCVDTDTESLVFAGSIYTFSGYSYRADPILDNAPSGDDFVQVEAGYDVSIALRSDGSIVSWGDDAAVALLGEPPLGNVYRHISALRSHAAALRSDGSIVSWGVDTDAQVTNTPAGNDFVTVEVGERFSLALRADGSLAAWGSDSDGQVSNVPTGTDFVAIAAGRLHGLALRSNGRLVSWGSNTRNQISDTPSDSDFVAIASGNDHNLAMRSDGSLVAWGYNNSSQVFDTPTGTGFLGITAGGLTNVAQRADGSLVGWGNRGELLSPSKDLRLASASSSHYNAIRVVGEGTIDNGLDTDGDGIPNATDTDDDNDGVEDSLDAFPLNSTETTDTDSDGIGNNADTDDDNDGVEDTLDAFPLNGSETTDSDSDGIGNNADTDDDNDGVLDTQDVFPFDPTEWADTDGDGIGDNADDADNRLDTDGDGIPNDVDTDDDNDGVDDSLDAFPLDETESIDTDSDGTGNNADTDDDNDGVDDTLDAFPLDPTESRDTDGDGIGDNADPDTPAPVGNVALAGIADQSSIFFGSVPARAIDGNTNGFWGQNSTAHTQQNETQPWWSVALPQSVDIDRIVIFNREDLCCIERLNNVHVFVSDAPFNTNATVEQLQAQTGIWHTFLAGVQGAEVAVPVNAVGRYVRIQLAGIGMLSLAEVEVIVANDTGVPQPTNLAPSGTADQSSVAYGGVAARAIDGNYNGFWQQSSTTYTLQNDVQPWWSISLPISADIDRIVIFNREDPCCVERLNNVHVFVSDAPFNTNATVEQLQAQAGIWHTFLAGVQGREVVIPVNVVGRYVRIQLAGTGMLSLAELEVFGVEDTDVTEPPIDQPINLSPFATADQSSIAFGGVPARAIDGNTAGFWGQNSTSYTEQNETQPWWGVALSQSADIDRIVIFNREDGCCTERLNNVHVFVSDTPFNANATVEQLQAQAGIWSSFLEGVQGREVVIPVNVVGRYVRIQLAGTGMLSLAEVEVIGIEIDTTEPPIAQPINLSPFGTAEQLSTAFGGVPERAIDGDIGGFWNQNSTSYTQQREIQPWWGISLAQSADIDRIVIFNREDECCIERLTDVHVFVSDTPFNANASVEQLQAQAGVWNTYLEGIQGRLVVVPVNVVGRYVRIQLAGNGMLSLAEVEVIGLTEQ